MLFEVKRHCGRAGNKSEILSQRNADTGLFETNKTLNKNNYHG